MTRRVRCKKCKELFNSKQIRRNYYDGRSQTICITCAESFCIVCLVPLTEREKKVLRDSEGITLCTKCDLREYVRGLRKQILHIEQKIKWAKSAHRCGECGEVNDSRDENRKITKRFCSTCRAIYGGKLAIARSAKKNKLRSTDDRQRRFTAVTGFYEP